MAFTDLADGKGKIYIAEKSISAPQKHPCPDCFSCQMCSDDRCLMCRGCCGKKKRQQEESGPETERP